MSETKRETVKRGILWSLFVNKMPTSLCVGEERTLTAAETAEINELLEKIYQDVTRLEDLFEQARDRFKKEG
jgi:hypothetical protein